MVRVQSMQWSSPGTGCPDQSRSGSREADAPPTPTPKLCDTLTTHSVPFQEGTDSAAAATRLHSTQTPRPAKRVPAGPGARRGGGHWRAGSGLVGREVGVARGAGGVPHVHGRVGRQRPAVEDPVREVRVAAGAAGRRRVVASRDYIRTYVHTHTHTHTHVCSCCPKYPPRRGPGGRRRRQTCAATAAERRGRRPLRRL